MEALLIVAVLDLFLPLTNSTCYIPLVDTFN